MCEFWLVILEGRANIDKAGEECGVTPRDWTEVWTGARWLGGPSARPPARLRPIIHRSAAPRRATPRHSVACLASDVTKFTKKGPSRKASPSYAVLCVNRSNGSEGTSRTGQV